MTANILLIEDDGFKAKRIVAALKLRFPGVEIVTARSVTSGLVALAAQGFSIVLLDMSLSTYDVGARESGGRPQNFGGLAVLEHMVRQGWPGPVTVVTQFVSFKRESKELTLSDLRAELETKYPKIYIGLVYYDSRETAWEDELHLKIKSYVLGEK